MPESAAGQFYEDHDRDMADPEYAEAYRQATAEVTTTAASIRDLISSHVCTERCKVETVNEYRCPTDGHITGCPGPCLDGRVHDPLTAERLVHHV